MENYQIRRVFLGNEPRHKGGTTYSYLKQPLALNMVLTCLNTVVE